MLVAVTVSASVIVVGAIPFIGLVVPRAACPTWSRAPWREPVFVLAGSGLDFGYVPKRLVRLAAIVVGGVCVALSAIVFRRW